ncbi:MAG: phytoene/squalene synthase family protein [Pontibacterium sp.]
MVLPASTSTPTDPLSGHSTEANYLFCAEQLPLVSRTFAACIGLLPKPLERAILLAYLLCRIADTIEDSPTLPVNRKTELLAAFKQSLKDQKIDCPAVRAAFTEPANADEIMAADCQRVMACYQALPESQKAAILPWITEMCEGMADFAQTYNSSADHSHLQALETEQDLDQYCYYVAGTVGHLLTDLFRQHQGCLSDSNYKALKALSTSFGLGLQLTNIIKDVADDRQRNWSFVPRQLCEQYGINVENLLDPTQAQAAQAVMQHLINKARGHLNDALQYCTQLPRSQYRIRLFCLAPLYFAIRTLKLAEQDPDLLNPDHKVKITRKQVSRTLSMTFLVAPVNPLVRAYYHRLAEDY